jgi:hypothetical protein
MNSAKRRFEAQTDLARSFPGSLVGGPGSLGVPILGTNRKIFQGNFVAFGQQWKDGHEDYSQTGSSGLAPAPELFPSGSGCRYLALPGICE